MRLRRVVPLLLLACLLIDFSNPSLPGAFSLEGHQLFVDGALTVTTASPARTAVAPRLALISQRVVWREHPPAAGAGAPQPRARVRPRFLERAEHRSLAEAAGDPASSTDPH